MFSIVYTGQSPLYRLIIQYACISPRAPAPVVEPEPELEDVEDDEEDDDLIQDDEFDMVRTLGKRA